MNEASGDVLVSINADLSHPPEKIPEIVAALGDPDVDFAIGSRYVPGAVISEQWSAWRRLISQVATALARPLTSAKDPLSGFYGLRRTTFQAAAPRHSLGFKIGLELMVRGRCKRIADIPITFSDRLHGKSKMRTRHMALYVVQIAVLAVDLQRKRPAKTPSPQARS
jgi:dolichol-phosphate mannosyltransferase